MLKDFANKETEQVYQREFVRHLPPMVQRVVYKKLLMLAAAETLADLRIPPSNHLEKLAKDRKGQYSIRVNDQWRICFEWHDGDAYRVELVDYH